MSFIINQNFDLKSPQFNFARDYFNNLAKLKAADENNFPDHFITNVAGDLYQLNKSYTPNDTTGRWRKIKLGSDVDLSGYATKADLNNKASKGEAVKDLSIAADAKIITIAGTRADSTITKVDIPLAAYEELTDKNQKVGLVTGAERKRLLALKLSGNSFNDTSTNTKGLRLSLNGTNSSVDISIAKPGDDSTYGLMSGADKKKLDDVANTYATKSDVSALSSALVYRGTVDAKYALPTKNVKIGDVYVVAAAGIFAGQTCEAGDMIIAQTASNAEGTPAPTWTVVQTNINGAVTTTDTLTGNKLIVGGGNRTIKAATGTGFVKISNGAVSVDNSTYLKSVPAATDTSVGGIKAENIGTLQPGFTVTEQNQVIDRFTSTTSPSNKIYPVELFYNGRAFVRVPWTDTNTTYPLASASANGLMSKDDKSKLDDLGLSGDSFNDASTNTKGLRLNLVGADSSYDIPIVKPSNDASTYGLMSGADKKKLDGLQNYTLQVASDNVLGGIKAVKTNKTLGTTQLQDNITDITDRYYPVLMVNSDKACVNVPWINPKSYIDFEFNDASDNAISNSTVTEAINGLKSDINGVVTSITSIPESEITKLFN